MLAELDRGAHMGRGDTAPVECATMSDTGLNENLLIELVMRTIYQRGPQTGYDLSASLRLPLCTIQDLLSEQRRLHVLEVSGSDARMFGDGAYIYALTEDGTERAVKAVQRCAYVGPAPVPFKDYVERVARDSVRGARVGPTDLRQAFKGLTFGERVLDEVGPALNAGTSIFLFGGSGNGKTSIATRMTQLLGDPIYVPFAIEIEGAIIEFYDPVVHGQVLDLDRCADRRWVKVNRPAVIAGGELTMDALDLTFSPTRRTYQAPFQMKANGGMFLVDDFGRQTMHPHTLLNRLIVPLENKVDYLTLVTGMKIEVPFDEIVVFSTNLEPGDLADEAFLRRIKYKIHLEDPTPVQYREIFELAAYTLSVQFDEGGYRHLLEVHYHPLGRRFRAVHPRDLLDQIVALSQYRGDVPVMTPDMIDAVARTYFAPPPENTFGVLPSKPRLAVA